MRKAVLFLRNWHKLTASSLLEVLHCLMPSHSTETAKKTLIEILKSSQIKSTNLRLQFWRENSSESSIFSHYFSIFLSNINIKTSLKYFSADISKINRPHISTSNNKLSWFCIQFGLWFGSFGRSNFFSRFSDVKRSDNSLVENLVESVKNPWKWILFHFFHLNRFLSIPSQPG